ncbi:hypothetical protein [Micropruina glycogenica]|nr:hypothetical protein [Micropruina glycogenica]
MLTDDEFAAAKAKLLA